MTSYELADVLQLTENYIRRQWPSIMRTYAKQNIELCKIGRGEDARYGIKRPGDYEMIWDVDEIEIY